MNTMQVILCGTKNCHHNSHLVQNIMFRRRFGFEKSFQTWDQAFEDQYSGATQINFYEGSSEVKILIFEKENDGLVTLSNILNIL